MGAMLKRRALAATGRAARHLPLDQAKLFAFLASPAVRADPWDLYQLLHRRGAVRPGPMGSWLVASHHGVTQVLRTTTTSVDESLAHGYPPPGTSPFSTLINRTLLFTDPPDHARLRRLVSRAFTPARVALLEPWIADLVEESVDRVRPAGTADLLADLAFPVPVAVICELLGVPAADRPRFLGWARGLAPRLDVDLFRDEGKERRGDEAAAALEAYLLELVGDPSRRRSDGLLASLLAVEEEGDRLHRDEVVALCALLLLAGFETTANLVGNGIHALLRHPGELARLRDGQVDPALAVEELLRYAGPVQFVQRVLLEELEVEGRVIPAGTLVALLVGAANRDPAVFADPDRLDVARDPNPHLAFSSGIHHCLGAALARVEARVLLLGVLRGLPGLRLAAAPRWRDTFVLRGLRSLPVAWDPS